MSHDPLQSPREDTKARVATMFATPRNEGMEANVAAVEDMINDENRGVKKHKTEHSKAEENSTPIMTHTIVKKHKTEHSKAEENSTQIMALFIPSDGALLVTILAFVSPWLLSPYVIRRTSKPFKQCYDKSMWPIMVKYFLQEGEQLPSGMTPRRKCNLGLQGPLQHLINRQTLQSLRQSEFRTLRLQGNFQSLPEQGMGELTCLRTLNLSGCNYLKALPAGFGAHLVNLEVLVLKNCHKLGSLPESISGLKALKVLDLSSDAKEYGRIIPMSLQSLPEGIGEQLVNLEVLVLKNCHKLGSLPESISGLKALKVLDLSSDAREGVYSYSPSIPMSIRALPEGFGQLVNLKELNMYGCSRVQTLPEGIGEQLINLEVLVLKNCHKLGSLPESISGLQALKVLDLSSDARDDWGDSIPMSIRALPEGFGKLINLEELNLQDCRQLLELSADFGGLKSLKVLNLSSDYYYTMSLRSLPEGFGNLTALTSLNLQYCPVKLRAALKEQLKTQGCILEDDSDDY